MNCPTLISLILREKNCIFGTIHFHYQIFSIDGPEIWQVTPSVVKNVGSNVSFSCTAKGNPEPEVRWNFQNQTKAVGKWQITLQISKVKLANAGLYTCTATNEVGSATKTVSLTVKGKSDVIGVNGGQKSLSYVINMDKF